jgi:glucosamine--fructose-6-phosphate aminotransferase (isomerizing)
MSHLREEIFEQPKVLERLVVGQWETAMAVAQAIQKSGVEFVVIAARGTSDNAATYGKYILAEANGLPVALATPSLFTIYRTPPRLTKALVMGISQSGESTDIVEVMAEGRRQGALTLAITNRPDSPLAQTAEHFLLCEAGQERSIAATKTYTAQLAALALLSVALNGNRERLAVLRELPEAVERTLALEERVQKAVERYRYMESCVVIGRGYNYATAYEIALKLKELTYIMAEPYSPADFMHGPIAMVEGGFPAIVVAPDGTIFENVCAFTKELRERGAELVVVSDRDEVLSMATTPLPLPVSVPEWLSPITSVVPGQLFSLYLTLAKGYDPDHPRGLKKVTKTS